MKKTITLTVGTTDFAFNVTANDHNDYVDTVARGGSVSAASHNFLIRVIDSEQKDAFKKFLDETPGAAIQIASHLKVEFSPVLEIAVKK